MRRKRTLTAVLVMVCTVLVASVPAQKEQRMSLTAKDMDIRDAIRSISKGYDLNIILDSDISGTITLHLSDVPIMEGLRQLAESQGLAVVKEGSVYRIRKKTDEERSSIRYLRGKLTVDVENMDVLDFLKELSSKTAVSIVPDSKVTGKITGKLYDVDLDDGIRALLEGNNFTVLRRRNIYQVSMKEEPQAGGARSRLSRQRPVGSDFFVDYDKGKLTIDVSNGNLEDVLKAISEQTDVQVVTYGGIKAEVNAKLFDRTLTEAFALLLGGTQYTFVEKNGIVLIGDRNAATPAGQALSKSELVHMYHIKADDVPAILPKNISANNVKVIKEQNALLISGTSEDIVKARDFLETIDIPTPQVRLDAIIVEYKENLEREVGLRFWRKYQEAQGQSYLDLPSPDTRYSSSATNALEYGTSGEAFKELLGVTNGILSRIPDDFFMVLRWLESEDKAKVLAKPSVLTLNGHKASINVDETQYFSATTETSSGGTATTASTVAYPVVSRFEPIKFGISLEITPWISKGGQITAEINPTVSNSEKTNNQGYPNVASRSLATTVRLNDGQTLVLGGLVKNKEEGFANKIPFLADLPIIGALFRYKGRSKSKTNLVVYITPHVITVNDTVSLAQELRDYDLYMLNTLERKALTGVRELRARRKETRAAEGRDTAAPAPVRQGSEKAVRERPEDGTGE